MKTLALSLLCALALGCTPDPSQIDGSGPLTSNVTDWRDEIVYQLLVDRFGDGDVNNDVNINPSALARYQGGDWQGVIDHIDYLKALGITAVWVSPVVRNVDTDANVDGYHGYWTQDFVHTNPHFGDLATLRRMVNALHAAGIKVILDIVTNHIGQLFYYDINNNGVPDDNVYGSGDQSPVTRVTEYDPDYDPNGIQGMTSLGGSGLAPIRWIYDPAIHRMPPVPEAFQNTDWYNRRGRAVHFDPYPAGCNYNNPPNCICDAACARDQTLHGDFPGGLKDLKTAITVNGQTMVNQPVADALIQAYTYWIGAADFDAFRIDTLKHVEHEFWQYFCPAVRQYCKQNGKKNFFMFGESFDGSDDLDGSYTMNQEVDSVFFFPQKFAVIDRVIKQGGPTTGIEQQWMARQTKYSSMPNPDGPVDANGNGLDAQQLLVNFLDNHDVPRFAFDKPCTGQGNCPALWQALAFIFTEAGIPCVYYGTEQEFAGGNDPENRERLWDTNYDVSGNTFLWVRRLTDLRKAHPALRHGDTTVRWSTDRVAGERDAGIFAFERFDSASGERALIVMNVNEAHPSTTQAPDAQGAAKMKVGFAPGTALSNALGDDPGDQIVAPDGTLAITVPPRGTAVYIAAGTPGMM